MLARLGSELPVVLRGFVQALTIRQSASGMSRIVGEHAAQLLQVRGLHHVHIKAGCVSSVAILSASVPGHGDH